MVEPILEDKPLSYADENAQFYRNAPREAAWGSPVYFTPLIKVGSYGVAGPHYKEGFPYNVNNGRKGNCTWFAICRVYQITGVFHKELIGDAWEFYKKYQGEKYGEGYIGDKLHFGDILVFSDNSDGHVIVVEQVDSNGTIHISESAYSNKEIYEGKTCITYTLNKSVLVCGNKVTLRPQVPFKETLVGVIHTGTYSEEESSIKELKAKVDALNNKLERIKAICNE